MAAPAPRLSTNSGSVGPLGSTLPRLWTPPLVDVEDPRNSYGHDVAAFAADVLGQPLRPWQRWLVVHAGELRADGRPRFRQILTLVARQQGKTHLLTILTLYWLFVEQRRMILSTSTNRDTAKEAWRNACAIARDNEYLSPEIGLIREANGEETLSTSAGCRYKIAASNRRGGRGLTIDRLIIDEVREHHSFEAYDAAIPATNAVADSQVFMISNMGDTASVVLNSLRAGAIEHLEGGDGDSSFGIFEWSSPPGSEPDDLGALALANPSLGYGVNADALLGMGMRAKVNGGEQLTGFKTEIMCMAVTILDPAIDPTLWEAAGTDAPVDLSQHRRKVSLGLDVSLDARSASLVAAAVVDGRTHLEVVQHWSGPGCTAALRAELPNLVAKVRPARFGWLPGGPAAAIAADLAAKPRAGWPPRRVELVEVRGDTAACCMGLADAVHAGQVQHPKDPLLNQHTMNATRAKRGDQWVYQRRGQGAIDCVYAAAVAAFLAKTAPPPAPDLVVL